MKLARLIALPVLLLAGFSVSAQVIPASPLGGGPTSTIIGQIQTATSGAINNGTLTFTLSQPAIVSGTASLATQTVACYTATQGNIVGIPDPLVPPVLSTNTSSGTLPAGTYYVEIYYVNAAGSVSAESPEANVILTSTGSVIVAAPVFQPANASGYGIAISTTPDTETIQGTVTGFTQFTQNGPLLSGATPQPVNNSSCNLYFSDQLVPTGTYYTVGLKNRNATPVAGFPQTWCTYGGAGATINVSQGTPTGNCNVSGVYYPTPIFSNLSTGGAQSINTPLTVTGSVTLSGGTNNLPGATNIGSLNGVYNATDCGNSPAPSWCSGSDIGAWTNAAWAACGGCTVFWSSGTYTQTTTITANSIADSIRGSGIASTILNYTGSGDSIVIKPSVFTVSHAGTFADFQLNGTSSGASAFHIINTINAKLLRVEVNGFTNTNATAYWLDNQSGNFTERTTFEDAWSNHNAIGWRFTVTSGGGPSFARTDLHSCHVNLNTGQIGMSFEAGVVYNSTIELNGNVDQSGATVLSILANQVAKNNMYVVHVEAAAAATLLNIGAGASFLGRGQIGTSGNFTNSINATGRLYIQASNDPLSDDSQNINGISPWIITNTGATGSFLFGAGHNIRWDPIGGNWLTQSDGSHNGGSAVLGTTTAGVQFYQIPDTATSSNQTVAPATFNGYLNTTIDANGVHTRALSATGTISVTGTGACATITTTVGGGTAGNLTCTGTTGASTLVITTGITATHSTECHASDLTTSANLLRQTTPLSATQCTIAGTVNANDVITFGATLY
jgi:hypothetical protein